MKAIQRQEPNNGKDGPQLDIPCQQTKCLVLGLGYISYIAVGKKRPMGTSKQPK